MSHELKLYSQQPNGVTFSDPSDPDYTVRFKTTSARKILDGQAAQNYITEITINDDHPVVIGAKTVVDTLSVRLRISGSLHSHDRLKEIVANLVSTVGDWANEDVFIGFQPTTLPVNTGDEDEE